MSVHTCGPPYGLKKNGSCLCCSAAVYHVIDVWAEGPLEGTPRRVGRILDEGTQVEFLLDDGSEADITFCLPCAAALEPDHYPAVWRAVAERTDLSLRLAGRSDNERTATLAAVLQRWPLAVLRKRREGVEPGTLVLDRR